MLLHLDYRDSRPIYVQIMDALRQQIASGVLLPEEKLPSVRELAASLSINPNTIQRSYRQLEMEGWIATVPGKGGFVCGIPEGDPQEELRLLRQFDDSARNLLLRGYTRQELIKRLEQEENHA